MIDSITKTALALCAGAFAITSLQAATITQDQWLQLNFTNGFYNAQTEDNFNYFIDSSDGLKTNETTGTSTTMLDSQGNAVDATLTASGFGGEGALV